MKKIVIPAYLEKLFIVLYTCAVIILFFLIFMPETSSASVGTGGSLPYESWLTNLRESVSESTRLARAPGKKEKSQFIAALPCRSAALLSC